MNLDEDGFYAQPDRDTLVQFTIYEHPTDFPDHYVVRRHEIRKGGGVTTAYYRLATTLKEARELVPWELFPIARDPEDPAAIVETWT